MPCEDREVAGVTSQSHINGYHLQDGAVSAPVMDNQIPRDYELTATLPPTQLLGTASWYRSGSDAWLYNWNSVEGDLLVLK